MYEQTKPSVEGRPLDERELIARSKAGDPHAYEQLVRIHQQLALRVAYLVVSDRAEAEDVTQEAFVKAYRSLGRFRSESPFRPWLLRIVRNEAINRLRGTRRRRELALRLADDPVSGDAAPSPETAVVAGDLRRRLVARIGDLSDRHRDVITHRFLLDLSEAETARVLRIPVGTVKSRTARALERLREQMEGER